jgi:hypothetical protein
LATAAGGIVHVLRHLGPLHLVRPQATAHLAEPFRLVVPAVHRALGEHAAAGVARQLAADCDAAPGEDVSMQHPGAEDVATVLMWYALRALLEPMIRNATERHLRYVQRRACFWEKETDDEKK